MKYFFFVFLLLMQLVSAQSKTTTLFFIRHAEKVDNSPNPDLSQMGRVRADNWNAIFSEVKFDAIYSTNFKRTIQTATPTATRCKIEITIYDPKKLDFNQLLKDNKGKSVLVVGHSNSIPDFINKIIKEAKYRNISENVFGNLYIITIYDEFVVGQQLLNLN